MRQLPPNYRTTVEAIERYLMHFDPVEFMEALIRNYSKGGYVDRERQRLIDAIDRATSHQPSK